MSTKILVGADPELFVYDRTTNHIVSAIPVLKKMKNDPIDLKDGIRLYADNVLLEFAFPPAEKPDEFVDRIRMAFKRIQKHLGYRYSMVPRASYKFSDSEIGKKPDVMEGQLPVEWEIGCNPNWDAYVEEQRQPAPFEDGLRTGSFHIHVGYEKICNFESRLNTIKILDIFLGCASILFDRDGTAPARRQLYGKAGEFRPTPYGIEYRVLGNFGLRSPKLVELIWDILAHSLNLIEADEHEKIIQMFDPKVIQDAINTADTTSCRGILLSAGMPISLVRRTEELGTPWMLEDWGII